MWTVFAVTLSVLILAVYEMTSHSIISWIKRPKIKVMPQKIEKFDNTVQTKQENTHIQFWLNVKNAGKNPVIQCKPRLRLIGVNNTLLVGNTKDHLPNEDFTMPWKTRNQEI